MNWPKLRLLAAAHWPWALVILLMGLGAFLRLYRQPDLMLYVGDQGRDATIVRQMIETHQPTLLGPSSYFGGFYRGPAWYYFLLVPFWLGGGNPGAGVALVGLVDVAAIALLFVLGRALFHPWVGLVASALWCCNTRTIDQARFMSNPSPLPFLVLVMLYCLYRLARGDRQFLLLLVPVWMVAWQFHDPPLLLLPMFAGFWILYRPRINLLTYAGAFGLALLTIAPFLVYEARHGFPNTTAMLNYALHLPSPGAVTVSSPGPGGRVLEVIALLDDLLPGIALPHLVFQVTALAGIAALIWTLRRPQGKYGRIFLLYLLTPLLFAFWPGPIDRVYVIMLFPLPFLLVGLGFSLLRARPAIQLSGHALITGPRRTAVAVAALALAAFVGYSYNDRLIWLQREPYAGSYQATS